MSERKEQAHTWSPTKRRGVWLKTQGRCWYCGQGTAETTLSLKEQFCIDHFIPWSEGGTHALNNLVPSCRSCNAGKRNRSLEEYRRILSRKGLPLFSEPHIAYLKALGVTLPPDFPCYPSIVFWFEEQGLEP